MVDNANSTQCPGVSIKMEFGEVKYDHEFIHSEDERAAGGEEVKGEIGDSDPVFGLDSFADEAVGKMLTITEEEFTVKIERFIDDEDVGKEDICSQPISSKILSTADKYKPQKKAPPPKEKPGICTFCNTGFPTATLYEDHMRTAHKKELPYSCKHCGKRFAAPQYVKRHETIHNPNRFKGPPRFACDMCDKRYHLKVSLEGHRKKTHLGYKAPARPTNALLVQHHSTKGIKNPNPFKKPLEVHPCLNCDLKFNKRSSLKSHMMCHTKEKPFTCHICQQPFYLKASMTAHIRKIHDRSKSKNPSGITPTRPKWQANQPCPCTICGKVFKVPSQLSRHMRLHTGEKPHKCEICGRQFRLSCGLKGHMKSHQPADSTGMFTFKCRVCGREGFKRFNEFRNHRLNAHRHIKFEGENEKSFACGICGKPHYQRIQAVICSLLGHDPSSLHKQMFKHKCPGCPPEKLGYHNLARLRQHWEKEHSGKFLPMELRKGMYLENLPKDGLPKVIINKKKAQEIQTTYGVTGVKSEHPLFIELDLLPIPNEEHFFKTKRKPTPLKKTECDKCNMQFSSVGNLQRHLRVVHDPSRPHVITNKSLKTPGLVSKRRRPRKPTSSQVIMETELKIESVDSFPEDSAPENTREIQERVPENSSMFNCRFECCSRKFDKIRALRTHERRAHIKLGSRESEKSRIISSILNSRVNLNDSAAVRDVIGGREVKIMLVRWEDEKDDDT